MNNLQYIRNYYGVPARRGARIRFLWPDPEQPRTGTVIGARDALLRVRMDGERRTRLLHPTWRIEWLEFPRASDAPAADEKQYVRA